eukprot:scaffold2767_cov177-Amphora_coffeaeformis.AAC.29
MDIFQVKRNAGERGIGIGDLCTQMIEYGAYSSGSTTAVKNVRLGLVGGISPLDPNSQVLPIVLPSSSALTLIPH